MGHDRLLGWGLRTIEMADRAVFESHFNSLGRPLSDYTFSQIFTWRNSLRLMWKIARGHLCVFANGAGDLTLLLPPIGDTGSDAALDDAFDLMRQYNAPLVMPDNPRSRVEYVSDELLARFDRSRFDVQPMGGDYVYDVRQMIDLPGGELASKRQAKNRFLRNYRSRVELYDPRRHRDGCLKLLARWKEHQDAHRLLDDCGASAIKRQKESLATELALQHAPELGLRGIVVYVSAGEDSGNACDSAERIVGFTFGEYLGGDQSSIVIEKTDLAVKGLAQFIFSEFCRTCWADRPLVNAGDDWGVKSLAWTKSSYRPVKLLNKYVIRQRATGLAGIDAMRGEAPCDRKPHDVRLRPATAGDLAAIAEIESHCFNVYTLDRRNLERLLRAGAIMMVAEEAGCIVGEAIALVHRRRRAARVFSLAVGSAHRGRKIGQRLTQSLLAEVRLRGADDVSLEVEQSNAAAVRLYEGLGFHRTRPLPEYYGRGRDGWRMMLRLAGPAQAPAPAVLTPAA